MALRTDYKNDILDTSINAERQYEEVTNPNGTKSYHDVTEYSQVGDTFDADLVNEQNEEINAKAPLASPAFTGTPTAPTQSQSTSDDSIATTSYVKSAMANFIDPNLRTSGKAADAKATGDRITAVQTSIPQIDDTLSVVGMAADAQAVGLAVTDVSNNVNSFAENNNIHFLANRYGYYINTSNELAENAILRCSDYVEVPMDAVSVTYKQRVESAGSLINVYPAMISYRADKTVYAVHSTVGEDEYRTMYLDPTVVRYIRFNHPNINRSDYGRSLFQFNKFSLATIIDRIPFLTQGGNVPDNSSVFALKPNKIYQVTSNSASKTNLPFTGFLGIIIPFNAVASSYPATATFIIAVSSTNRFFYTHSWGTEVTFTDWVELFHADDSVYKYRRHLTSGVDLNTFTDTGTYLVSAGLYGVNDPFNGLGGTLAVFADTYGNLAQLAFRQDGEVAFRRKSKTGGFGDWIFVLKSAHVGDFTGTFTAVKQTLNTGIQLKAGVTYIIQNNSVSNEQPYSGFYNAFISINPSAYSKHIGKWETSVRFTPTLDGTLAIYNPTGNGGYGYVGGVNLSVYREKDYERPNKKVYTVGKESASYDFTSFTDALLALKDDHDDKEIHIYAGEYDLWQEYHDAGVPVYEGDSPTYDYFDYCVWIPENTHIIGHGIVRLKWMPNAQDTTYNESATVSPINVAGSMTLENVEIHAKNSRYCIHDDPLGKREYVNAVKKYINVRCYKYANDTGLGWTHTLGFGFDYGDRYEFHNCMFMNTAGGRTLYGHSRAASESINLTEVQSPNIIVTDCVMQTNGTRCVVLGNAAGNSNLHVRVDMNNCYVSGEIYIADEGSSGDGGTRRNAFDLKTLGGNITADKVFIRDQSNPYPAQIYSFT